MEGLKDRSIMVTGGASGIGLATATLLARAGCNVTIADLNEESGHETARSIQSEEPGRVNFVKTDVSREDDVQRAVAAAVATYGRLDGAVNAAGVGQAGKPIQDIESDQFDRVSNINLRGMFLCLKYQIPALSSGGSIVAISSAAATLGVAGSAEYCASKAGILGLVRGAAVDCARSAIRINCVLPGSTLTPMTQHSLDKYPHLNELVERIPVGRMAQPKEIANAAIWLLSDYASYVTGAMISVDGGLSLV